MSTQGLIEDLRLNLPLPEKITLPGGEVLRVDLRDMDKTAEKVFGSATDVAFQIAVALAIVIFGWLISSWLATITQRALVRARVEETLAAFIGSFARYTFFLLCAVTAFNVMGLSIASAVAVFGAIGLAVAFALRNTLTHLAAGLMLIVNRPFKVGDFIELEQVMGTVKRVTLFNTEINTLQNQRLFIPNSRIWDNVLRNHTYNDVRAVELKVSFDYDDSPLRCKELLRKLFAEDHLILKKPEPYVETHALDDSGVTYLFRVWVRTKDMVALRARLLDDVWLMAQKHGLTIPYPQQVVRQQPAEKPSARVPATSARTRSKVAK